MEVNGSVILGGSNSRQHSIYIARLTRLDIAYIGVHGLNGVSFKGNRHIIKNHFSGVVDAKHNIGFRTHCHRIGHYIDIAGAQTGILLNRNIHNNVLLRIFKFRAVIFFLDSNTVGTLIHSGPGCKFCPQFCALARRKGIHHHGGGAGFRGKYCAVGYLFRFQIKEKIGCGNRG